MDNLYPSILFRAYGNVQSMQHLLYDVDKDDTEYIDPTIYHEIVLAFLELFRL